METLFPNLPYIKMINNNKSINTNLNNSDISNKQTIKTSFSQGKTILKRLKQYSNFKNQNIPNNLSTTTISNHNFSFYRKKFLDDIQKDINKNNINKNSNKIRETKNSSTNYDFNIINSTIGNDFFVQKFLEQNISKNRSMKILSKYLKPLHIVKKDKEKEEIYNRNSIVFRIKKKILFEKEIPQLSLYGNFDNYKGKDYYADNIVKIQEYIPKNNEDKNNTNNLGFHDVKKISLDRILLEKGGKNNGKSFYKNNIEKKDDIIKGINNNIFRGLIKNKSKSNKNIKESNDYDIDDENNELEDNKYLKKIILRNRIKKRNIMDLTDFDTYDQKNRKVISIINENFKNKNRNKSVDENLKIINQKNYVLFKKRKMNRIKGKIDVISHQLNNINKKLDGFVYKAKNNFDKDVKKIFD